MIGAANNSFVRTIKERCRLCYTCVRECPAKAIRVMNGQAEIIGERCINCGNCVRVCSQGAKRIVSSVDKVKELLLSKSKVAACLAPSFPAEFVDVDAGRVVGLLRKIGFDYVYEVAFGADLVARAYRELLDENDGRRYISTPCPAIIAYVEKYHPDIVDSLVPIVSPMIALARCLRNKYGEELKIVFIGPCIAKKQEAASGYVEGEIDCVLTFVELRELTEEFGIAVEEFSEVESSCFDFPVGGAGSLFPLSRGLLQAADMKEDLITGEIVTADGRTNFVEAIKEFEDNSLDARLLEILACTGCIAGAGVSNNIPLFARRAKVSEYVRCKMKDFDYKRWESELEEYGALDLGRRFSADDHRIPSPSENELRKILKKLGKFKLEDELNCGACGYETCREHAIAIYKGLAENEMCLPYTIEQLRRTIDELAVSNEQLASVRETLVHAEKLASMGQLAAGIAHEINNPLGVVLMFAHLLMEQVDKGSEIYEDLQMIVEQADRCKKIVSGLLHFARQNKLTLEDVDLAELSEKVIKSMEIPEGISVLIARKTDNVIAEVDRDQISQVLTNLISNAISAIEGEGGVKIEIGADAENVEISVIDTGRGIPQENLSKIFEPFFTTKQIGEGTGLGLSVTYGIVKMHRGDISVESNADVSVGRTGTKFTVRLPKRQEMRRVSELRKQGVE